MQCGGNSSGRTQDPGGLQISGSLAENGVIGPAVDEALTSLGPVHAPKRMEWTTNGGKGGKGMEERRKRRERLMDAGGVVTTLGLPHPYLPTPTLGGDRDSSSLEHGPVSTSLKVVNRLRGPIGQR
ncbi:uncharacterized protein LOC127000484 [Eriocheir sinensis]|uniref:uncharacterized protein LOC127000484 n=1 Tax=Eriocheir sinensis TaxID=95602 RepID=UPI0021C8A413|nr:uncharacterized protein LOC127000484 [Eriocheir sinensis]